MRPNTDAINFIALQVLMHCGTESPKYCDTIQKPESLTWEQALPPAHNARMSSSGWTVSCTAAPITAVCTT